MNAATVSAKSPSSLDPSSTSDLLKELEQLLQSEKRMQDRTKLRRYQPYSKQLAFHAAGVTHRERLLMAGNQLGKTFCGAAEMAYHLTGEYPEWWPGRRWTKPIRAWAGSETWDVTRDGVQRILVGEPKDEGAWGTGLIPHADIVDWSRRQGAPDALD